MARRRNRVGTERLGAAGQRRLGRRRLLGLECLEGRCVLSASPWGQPAPQLIPVHESPAALFAPATLQPEAAVTSVKIVETLHHGPAVLVTGDVVSAGDPSMPPAAEAVGQFAAAPRPGALNELGALVRAELAAPVRPATFVVNPAQVQPPDMAAGTLRAAGFGSFSSPADAAQRAGSLPLIIVLADNRGVAADNRVADNSSARLLVWMSQMVPPGVVQGLEQGYGQWDLRGKFAEFAHDTLFTGRMASWDGARSGGDRGFGDEASLEGERHAINPALFGQSAKNDSMFAGAGRSVGEAQAIWFELESGEADEAPGHEAAGHLVAMGDAAAVLASAIWAAGSRTLGAALEGDATLDAALHELLAPRFAVDAAAIGDAIRDLVSEADELGISLLGLLADPTRQGEMALVAVVTAGLVYRHWRARERRDEAESRAMLAARFVRGPASLRLYRGTIP